MLLINKETFQFNWNVLKNPWMIIIGMVSGIFLGLFDKDLSLNLLPLGDVYLSFLNMCVIPIMSTAIITSFGRLLQSRDVSYYLKRIVVIFLVGLFLTSLISVIAAVLGNPGNLEQDSLNQLGKVLIHYESNDSGATQEQVSFGLYEFLKMIIPTNIFNALYEGKNLQILFFSIVLGLSMGLLPLQKAEQFLDITEAIFNAFEKVIAIAMYILPLGLFFMLAGQIAQAGIDILLAMMKFVLIVHIVGIFLVLAGSAIITVIMKKPFLQIFKDLREPLIIAFSTRNSYAAMPSVFDALRNNFQLPKNLISLVVPLSIVICRFSMVIIFTIGAVFMAQLYSIPLGFSQLLSIFLLSVLAALAGAGAPGVVAISMITIVLGPLGLPSGAAIGLLLAVNAIIDPMLTIINIHLTCVVTAIIIKGVPVKDDLIRQQVLTERH